jgi:Na+-transporting NADH:ubiquinone oxidoreductase subunit NqrB
MESILKYILYTISLVALITGLSVLVGGAAAISGSSGAVEATVDNELRFFSVYWIAYGAFCFWVAKNLQEQKFFIPLIALVFFVSGIGRLISILLIGPPSNILILVMVLELVMPIAMYVMYRKLYVNNMKSVQSDK